MINTRMSTKIKTIVVNDEELLQATKGFVSIRTDRKG